MTTTWSLEDDAVVVEADPFSLGAALMKNIVKATGSSNETLNEAASRQYSASSIKQVDQIMFQPFCNRELFTTAIGVCDAIFPPLPCPCPKCPTCPTCPTCPRCPPGVPSNTKNYCI